MLFKAWIGYKRANNPKNGEGFFDRLHWAQIIQNVQTDLGLQRSLFPQLGLLGDVVFLYDKVKEWEIQDLDNELSFKEYKKQKRAHIKEIVETSFLSVEERQWLREGFAYTPTPPQQTIDLNK
jgi:predicted DNA-binding transcriptional regulator